MHIAARASDLLQETFCRLVETPQLLLHSHPRRYLAMVARRLLIDDVRRRTSERCFLEAFTLHMGGTDVPAADRVAEAVQQLSMLAELLGALPAKPAGPSCSAGSTG